MFQIHELIKNERVKAGLSEEEMARKLGIPRSTYQYWEENTPKIDKIKAVAVALNLPEDYFFVSDDEKVVAMQIPKQIIQNPTVEKLAQAVADQAKANKEHAEGYRIQAEAYKELLEIMRDMRKEMARADTQTIMDANLVRTLTGVEVLNQDSQKLLKMVKELTSKPKAHEDPLSQDGDKKAHQIGGDGKKPGKHRG